MSPMRPGSFHRSWGAGAAGFGAVGAGCSARRPGGHNPASGSSGLDLPAGAAADPGPAAAAGGEGTVLEAWPAAGFAAGVPASGAWPAAVGAAGVPASVEEPPLPYCCRRAAARAAACWRSSSAAASSAAWRSRASCASRSMYFWMRARRAYAASSGSRVTLGTSVSSSLSSPCGAVSRAPCGCCPIPAGAPQPEVRPAPS